jgi:hypothetical protein
VFDRSNRVAVQSIGVDRLQLQRGLEYRVALDAFALAHGALETICQFLTIALALSENLGGRVARVIESFQRKIGPTNFAI